MVLDEHIPGVMELLRNAARQRGGTCRFSALFAVFPSGTDDSDVYDTLEAACTRLAPTQHAIISALLAKRSTGLPGQVFYDTFRVHRSAEYARIAGAHTHPTTLTLSQMQEMADLERERTHALALAAGW
jgi:hypothetical protein